MMFVSWPAVKKMFTAVVIFLPLLIWKKLADLLRRRGNNKHKNRGTIMYSYRSGSHWEVCVRVEGRNGLREST